MSFPICMQASGVPPWLPLNDAIQLLHEDPLADSLASHPDVSDEGVVVGARLQLPLPLPLQCVNDGLKVPVTPAHHPHMSSQERSPTR